MTDPHTQGARHGQLQRRLLEHLHRRLNLRFSRAARAGADVLVSLTRDASGIWRGGLPEMAPGKWYVEIGNDTWRLAAPARIPAASGKIALRAGVPLSAEQ